MINRDINALKKVMKRHGYTESHFATMECSISKIRRLLDKGTGPNARDETGMTPLHYATQDCPEAIPILIKYGTDPHAGDEGDMTPLHYATMHRSLNAAEALIKHSDVNARDKDGRTLLALEYGHCNVVLPLIESGADVNVADKNDVRPIHYPDDDALVFCGTKYDELLEHSADPTVKDGSCTKPAELLSGN